MEYTRQQIIEKCQMAFNDAKTFYQADIVNYRGKSLDTNEYYTEIIAEFLCNNIEDYKASIPMITRKISYKTASHTGRFSENSNRTEEIVAIKMFNQSKNGCIYDFIGEIIDYQTPLKSSRKDVAGKIDLLSYDKDNKVIHILELKKPDSIETMLRCVLEGYTYLQTVDSEKLINDFKKVQDKPIIKANPFVFKCAESNPYQEMQQEERKWLQKLMVLLDSIPLYIAEIDGQYFVTDK